ncbi:protein of unknown function [Burkholderia multivorans]
MNLAKKNSSDAALTDAIRSIGTDLLSRQKARKKLTAEKIAAKESLASDGMN